MVCFYSLLDVDPLASQLEIRAAFKRRALAVHPDKGGCKEAFQQVLLAFETLTDAVTRGQYDRHSEGFTHGQRDIKCSNESKLPGKARPCKPTPAARQPKEKKRRSAQDREAKIKSSNEQLRQSQNLSPPDCKKNKNTLPLYTKTSTLDSQVRLTVDRGTTSSTQARPRYSIKRDLLGAMYFLLQKLPPKRRMTLIQAKLSVGCRLALETRILEIKKESHASICPAVCSATILRPDGEDDQSTSSNDTSESSNELVPLPDFSFSSDDVGPEPLLALLDGTDDERPEPPLALLDGTEYENPNSNRDSCAGSDAESDDGIETQDIVSSPALEEPLLDVRLEEAESMNVVSGGAVGKTGVRGISCSQHSDGSTWYMASVMVDMMIIFTRWSTELSVAIDCLVVLTAIRTQIRSYTRDTSFVEAARYVVPNALDEHNVSAESLGLGFRIQLSTTLLGRILLSTPTCHNLERILRMYDCLSNFRSHKRGPRHWRIRRNQLNNFETEWKQFSSAYLASLQDCLGKCPDSAAAQLEEYRHTMKNYRERLMEGCERLAMRAEERLQQAAACKERQRLREIAIKEMLAERWNRRGMWMEEMLQRRAERHERLWERGNRRAMAREDRLSCVWQHRDSHEGKLARRICRLAERWQRREALQSARKARKLAAIQSMAKRAQLAADRESQRMLKKARDERWRQMNRRDITTAELLGLAPMVHENGC